MASPENHSRIARFGVFEVDLSAGELRKSGVKLRLQGQPFQVLTVLLERAGEVVSREELQQKLWPADTFVDFDHSLNTAVNKIREVLGDSASSPRFIETIARRGYRFIGGVQTSTDAEALEQEQPKLASHAYPELPRPHRGITRLLFGLLQIMYLIFYVEALLHWHALDRIEIFNLGAPLVASVVIVTAGVSIPLRFYLLAAVAFDHSQLGMQF